MPSWLAKPVLPEGGFQVWHGAALLILMAVGAILFAGALRKKRSKKKSPEPGGGEPVLEEQPEEPAPPLLAANLQGQGNRSEQQDSFYLSPLSDYGEKGVLAILCDGMGGMADGKAISEYAVAQAAERFSDEDPAACAALLKELSREVYGAHRGSGGTTLVMTHIRSGRLWFWSAGDSDLFLYRSGRMYALNRRQELWGELVAEALFSGTPLYYAYSDPQKGALVEYIGKEDVSIDYSRFPLPLQKGDKLLLCSDGVSDTLELSRLQTLMACSPEEALLRIGEAICEEGMVFQDNYTAVMLEYGEG